MVRKMYSDSIFMNRNVDFTLIESMSYVSSEHCHDFFEIFIIVTGKMQHILNDTSQILSKRDMVFVRPDDIHQFKVVEDYDCSFLNISFTAELLQSICYFLGTGHSIEHYCSHPIMGKNQVSEKIFTEIMDCYDEISTTELSSFEVQISAKILLSKLLHTYVKLEKTPSDSPDWLIALCEQLHKKENFTQKAMIMCTLSDKTHEHITRSFKKYLHTTPTNYITELRLNYFANLLLMTNMSILDICYECGYSALSHAYHIFNSKYNMTPLQYREKFKVKP